MAGVLSFTLGLEASKFLSEIGLSSRKLLEFFGSAELLEKGFEKVWQQIERGAALKELSARTDESVASLVKLQAGFRMTGIEADSVGPMIIKMQKALGGVTDEGESTAGLFSALHLNLANIKKLDAAAQFLAIGKALANVNHNQAAGLASKLFGREGAGNILQIARSTEEFKEGLTGAAKQAALFERNAGAFNKIETSFKQIKGGISGFWAGIAAGSAPAIQDLENIVKKIDFTSIGEKVGHALEMGIGIIRSGHLSELLGESFKFGLDLALIYAAPVFERMGYLLLKAFETPLIYLQTGLDYIADQLFNNPKWAIAIPTTGKGSLLDGLKNGPGQNNADSWGTLFKERLAKGLEFSLGAGTIGLKDILSDSNERFSEATQSASKALQDFQNKMNAFFTPSHSSESDGAGGRRGVTLDLEKQTNASATALEKIGLVIGRGSPTQDYHRATALNTGKLIEHSSQTNRLLERLINTNNLGGSFANIV